MLDSRTLLRLGDWSGRSSPGRQQSHQIVHFLFGKWFEFRAVGPSFRIVGHAKIGAPGDDDAPQNLITVQREENWVIDSIDGAMLFLNSLSLVTMTIGTSPCKD